MTRIWTEAHWAPHPDITVWELAQCVTMAPLCATHPERVAVWVALAPDEVSRHFAIRQMKEHRP